MKLTVSDLFNLEARVRSEADRIRFRNPESDLSSPSVSADAKIHIGNERDRAADFDRIGDLLVGLQADWDKLGPEVRAGYVRLRREFEAAQEQTQISEDAA